MSDVLGASKVAWVTPVFGVHGRSLYWKPLLNGFASRCGSLEAFTAEISCPAEDFSFPIHTPSALKRLYKNERTNNKAGKSTKYGAGVNVISPNIIRDLYKSQPQLMICNELGLMTLYGAMVRLLLRKRSKMLLIVEARPFDFGNPLLGLARTLLRRRLCSFADAILTNNAGGQEYLVSRLGVRPDRIVTRPYLVSTFASEAAAPKAAPDYASGEKLRCLYVGQLIQRKGVQCALQALASLDSALRARVQMDIVGDGPMRGELQALCRKLGIDDSVLFHGRQPYEALSGFYNHAHAFIFPTYSDYRALGPFEAMSAGLAILASIHDGGIDETVDEGNNGFRFDPHHIEQLTEKLATILENPSLVNRFSACSLEISKRYTLDSAIDALVEASTLALRSQASSA